jgi:RNase adaptor protein for sRNA GlmZ degradation
MSAQNETPSSSVIWKVIPNFDKYELLNTGLVRRIKSKRIKTIDQKKKHVQIYKDGKHRSVYIAKLLRENFSKEETKEN